MTRSLSKWAKVVDDLIRKTPIQDISFLVKLIAMGIFFVLVAITYSIIYRGSVDIDVGRSSLTLAK